MLLEMVNEPVVVFPHTEEVGLLLPLLEWIPSVVLVVGLQIRARVRVRVRVRVVLVILDLERVVVRHVSLFLDVVPTLVHVLVDIAIRLRELPNPLCRLLVDCICGADVSVV